MNTYAIVQSIGPEDSPAQFMRRVTGNAGTNITQTTLSTLTVKVYDLGDPDATFVYSATLTIASVIFDTLQTDSRWTEDATGYNFLADLPGTAFPTGGTTYQVEFLFTPASGNAWIVIYQHTTLSVRT